MVVTSILCVSSLLVSTGSFALFMWAGVVWGFHDVSDLPYEDQSTGA